MTLQECQDMMSQRCGNLALQQAQLQEAVKARVARRNAAIGARLREAAARVHVTRREIESQVRHAWPVAWYSERPWDDPAWRRNPYLPASRWEDEVHPGLKMEEGF